MTMIENNVWSLGFSPEEQVESVISCALISGYKKFGIIAPDNLYGRIISRRAKELVSTIRIIFSIQCFCQMNKLITKITYTQL